MKKALTIINYSLIMIAVIISYYMVFTRDKEIGLILKDASIIITITMPYIIEKIFNKKFSLLIKLTWIIFIFLAHFLGATMEVYNQIKYFDKITHFASGILTALFALVLMRLSGIYDKNRIILNITFIIALTLSVAVFWEFFEYFANILFGGDAQRVALTGVNDTMQDMLVAFLGGLMIILFYWYEESSNKIGFIKRFMTEING